MLTLQRRIHSDKLMCSILMAGKQGRNKSLEKQLNIILKLLTLIPITLKLSLIEGSLSTNWEKSRRLFMTTDKLCLLNQVMLSAIIIWVSAWIKRGFLKKR